MIIHEDLIQGSEEWFQVRKGRATASQAKLVLTPTGKLSASRIKYCWKLAAECVVDDPMEFMGNKFTEWGNDHEPEARSLFEELTNAVVHEVGFCTREDGVIGFSPDGLMKNTMGDDWGSGLEIKCPSRDKHVEYVMSGGLPDEYKLQVHWSLAASGLTRWMFMSYFPGLAPLIVPIDSDEFTKTVKQAQDDFLIDYARERSLVLSKIMIEAGEEEAR